MNTEELNLRTKTLANACIKVSILLPANATLGILIKDRLLNCATDLAVKSRGLGMTQNAEYFANRLNSAAEAANSCGFWLEMIKDEQLMDVSLINPLIEESNTLLSLFLQASKKVKDKLE